MLGKISGMFSGQAPAAFCLPLIKIIKSDDLCLTTITLAVKAPLLFPLLVDYRFSFREHNQSAVASADIITHESCTPLGEK